MAAEFDISKHSTCHDIHNGHVWVDHHISKRRLGRMIGDKINDE